MPENYRALCAELVDALDSGIPTGRICMSPLANRTRAALAESEAEEPTIPSRYRGHEIAVYRDGFHAGYKEALAKAAKLEGAQ